MIIVKPTIPAYAEALEELQRIVFPGLSQEERLRAGQYRRHLELFPEGQFVLLDGERLIGATSTMRTTGEEGLQPHSFIEMGGGGWMDPTGQTGNGCMGWIWASIPNTGAGDCPACCTVPGRSWYGDWT